MVVPVSRRALAAVVSLALVAGLLAPALVDAPPAGAVGLGQALTDKPVYGGNEVVRASGNVTFLTGCKEVSAHRGIGVDDIFQPWADLYVVSTGSTSLGGSLADVNGKPNVIFGGLAGGFVEEVIAYTEPGGNLPAGTYDLVIDECQDGIFDDDDALMSEAFRVVVPLGTAPAVIGGPSKKQAASLAVQYRLLAKAWDALLKAINKRKIGGVSLGFASDMSIAIFEAAAQTDLPDPRPAASAALVELGRRQAGIAADPPDPAFQAHAGLDAGDPIGAGVHADPLEDALLAAARSQAVDAALLGALVTAVERHQGAAEVGNGDWMAAHARDALELLDLIEARATVSSDLLHESGNAYAAQFFDLRSQVDQLLNRPASYLFSGDPANIGRAGSNRGLTFEEIEAGMEDLLPLRDASPLFSTASVATTRDALDALGAELEAQALGFGDLRASLEAALVGLAAEGRDGPRPTASAGGPYAGTVGAPIALDASASAGPAAVVGHAWDLDLDGEYDDATGPTPSFVPDQPGQRVVAVEVTDATGATDVAFATVDVAVGDLPPVITATTPDPAVLEGDPGTAASLSVTAEDPEAQPVVVSWRHEGVEVGTGTDLPVTLPAVEGTTRYDAVATDPAGNLTYQTFLVTALGPDADSDLWRAPGDCDDADADVNPGEAEVTGNGKDDDCDPATTDDPQAPKVNWFRVDPNQGPTGGWQEGDRMVLEASWSHPSRYSGQEFTWTVDWKDGATSEGAVSGTTVGETQIFADHVYRSSGRQAATVCITEPTGLTACVDAATTITSTPALPAPPVVHPADLEAWTSYDVGRAGEYNVGGASEWFIAPGGFSGIQETNRTFPNVLLSDEELVPGPDGTARFAVDLGTIGGDDDVIGLTVGLDPGEAEQDDADWLAVNMWGHAETRNAVGCGGSGSSTSVSPQDVNLLLRYRGYPHYEELNGYTLHLADATDPLCNDDMGSEILDAAKLPAPLGRQPLGYWKNLVHPAELSRPDREIGQLYRATVEVSPEEITVWIDGVELLHAVAPPGDPFPMGRVGLLSRSQPDTRLIGHTQVPVVDAVQGTAQTFSAPFADADLQGSHTAVIEWGDGTPATEATIDPVPATPGFWTASADHAYATVGQHLAEVCVTDTEDQQVGCGEIVVVVDDAPPVVDAGADRTTVGPVSLLGATVVDPGPFDVLAATVDWGDGSGVVPATVEAFAGNGVLAGDHVYAAPGIYTAEVCVQSTPALGPDPLPGDEVAAEGCDQIEVEVVGPVAPQAYVAEGVSGAEGDAIEVPVGFHSGGPEQAHTLTIDWGDGDVTPDASIVDRGVAGFGAPTHVWADDGTYEVTATVCVDGEALCDTVTTDVEVANAAPEVDEPIAVTEDGGTHSLAATFTDPGVDDTHIATVDWGEGAGPVSAVVTPDPGGGGGSVAAEHTYAGAGAYVVEVCVTDDDGAGDCAAAAVDLVTVPGPPVDVSAIGGDGEARVSWQAPADDGGSPITGYEVEVTPGGAVVATGSTDPQTVVGGLTNGVDHTFRVRAGNAVGWGPWSDPSNVARPRASCTTAPFPDVPADHPFCPEITWMVQEGISKGYADGNYWPGRLTSRQAMAAFLYRLAGSPDGDDPSCALAPFPDVSATATHCGEIAWMVDAGITTGYADGTFRPDASVSRQAMAAFFQRYAGEGDDPTWACTAAPFPDVPVDHPFCAAIRWMRLSGMTEGYADGTYRPTVPVSRQAMAAMVQRYDILTGP